MHVAIIGAGALGGWTAFELVRRGVRVTLVDAWGAGNVRSSSGGETRALRAVYGGDEPYTRLALESLDRWRQVEQEWGVTLFEPTGVLWMCRRDESYLRSARRVLERLSWPLISMTADEVAARYPRMATADLHVAWLEPHAGLLHAERATRRVCQAVVEAGGSYLQAAVPGPVRPRSMMERGVKLSDGTVLSADAVLFACGPWLPRLFPDLLGRALNVTRQPVLFLGTPAGDVGYADGCPVWLDWGERIHYGFPAGLQGFKVGDDTRGEAFEPTGGDRTVRPDEVAALRDAAIHRFPGLRDAPVLGGRVCQYTNTADGHLMVGPHPEDPRVWVAGGGSGHGFKLGPAVGRLLSAAMIDRTTLPDVWRLDRPTPTGPPRTQFDRG